VAAGCYVASCTQLESCVDGVGACARCEEGFDLTGSRCVQSSSPPPPPPLGKALRRRLMVGIQAVTTRLALLTAA
jgi:hypothetical protein